MFCKGLAELDREEQELFKLSTTKTSTQRLPGKKIYPNRPLLKSIKSIDKLKTFSKFVITTSLSASK